MENVPFSKMSAPGPASALYAHAAFDCQGRGISACAFALARPGVAPPLLQSYQLINCNNNYIDFILFLFNYIS